MRTEEKRTPIDENSYPKIGSLLAAAIWLGNARSPNEPVRSTTFKYDVDRWIACADVDGRSTSSRILLGVSLTSNPTNGWTLRCVKANNEVGP